MRLTKRSALRCLAAAALAATPAFARAQSENSDGPPGPPPIDPTALQTLSNLVTRMAVPVHIAGEGPFHFVIDTGATRTTLALELADSLALEPGPEVVVHGVVDAERARTVIVPRLDFASSRIPNLIAPVFPRARLGIDGLLGVDVLGDYRLVFDMAAERVSLLRSPRTAYVQRMDVDVSRINRANELRGHREYGQLTVTDVAADGVDVAAFIDSGAQHSIGNMALFNSLAVRRPTLRDHIWETPIIGVTGQTTTGRLAYLRALRLGRSQVRDLPVLFADLHAFRIWRLTETPALLMGADVLGMFRTVTMDYGQMRMVFGSRLTR
ncbi:MAG: aspartyl protease family protein [Brevundimonas sp.]|uniref:aspartyl protease family protein n=1 Tax=Brevundimonas sp. TaxID=1871086 RepID=UPI00391B9F30